MMKGFKMPSFRSHACAIGLLFLYLLRYVFCFSGRGFFLTMPATNRETVEALGCKLALSTSTFSLKPFLYQTLTLMPVIAPTMAIAQIILLLRHS